MNNKVNILCLKGFINMENINKNYVYIYKNNELLTVIHNMKHFDKSYLVKLATGTSLRLHPEAIVSGSIFEKDIIKNDIDTDYISKFKEDDYIYTPFKSLEYGAIKDTVKLVTGSRRVLEYFNTNLLTYCESKNITLKEFEKSLEESKLEASSMYSDLGLLSKTYSEIKVNKELINFLSITILRGKLSLEQHKVQDSLTYKCKTISYRFKKDNPLHLEMYQLLDKFFKHHSIKSEKVDYDHYFYINLYHNLLFDYFNKFKLSFYREILDFDKEFQEQFLNNIFKFTGNNFYTTPDCYHTLKEMCYNNRKVISFINRSNNSKSFEPISASLMDLQSSDKEIYPDVILLDNGYLTRIIDINFCDNKHRIIKDYLLIG